VSAIRSYERAVIVASLKVSAVIAAVLMPVSALLSGWPGFWGAVVGGAVVVLFLVVHLLLGALTRSFDPALTMAMVMMTYFTKIFALAILLVAFREATWMDRRAFGVTAICITAAWLIAEVRTYLKARFVFAEGYAARVDQSDQGEGQS